MPQRGIVDTSALDKLDARVTAVLDAGLVATIDFHQDVFGEGFHDNGAPLWACDASRYAAYATDHALVAQLLELEGLLDGFWTDVSLQDQYIAAAVAVAKRFQSRFGVDWLRRLQRALLGHAADRHLSPRGAAALLRAVRRRGRGGECRLRLLPGPLLCGAAGLVTIDLAPMRTPNVVYVPHYYGESVSDQHAWDGDVAAITQVLGAYAATAAGLSAPWMLGEWGGFTDSADFSGYLRAMLATMENGHAGALWYDYSRDNGGYSPLMSDGSEKKAVVDILARVYPKAAGGQIARTASTMRPATSRSRSTPPPGSPRRPSSRSPRPASIRQASSSTAATRPGAGRSCRTRRAPSSPSPTIPAAASHKVTIRRQ